jgi:hypothetical protein
MATPLVMRVQKPGDWTKYVATDTYHYFGGIVDGKWKINRISVTNPLDMQSATVDNNSSVISLDDAWVSQSLNYE